MSIKATQPFLPIVSFTTKIKRLPRKQKKRLKKFQAVSESILAEAEASLVDFGGYIEDVMELDEILKR